MPDGMTESPDQPAHNAQNGYSDYYFPETCDKPDHKYDGEQPEATLTATATGAASTAMSPVNRDVFPWSCVNMSYTHNYPPKRYVCQKWWSRRGSNPQTVKCTSALITVGTFHSPIFNCIKVEMYAFSGEIVFFQDFFTNQKISLHFLICGTFCSLIQLHETADSESESQRKNSLKRTWDNFRGPG